MSHGYRLLGEGLSRQGGAALAGFPADARKTRLWVAALPRANAAATQQSLSQALESLGGQRLDGASRLAVLEELRPAIGESVGLLKREYAGSALPLSVGKAAAAQQVEAFQIGLAHAYRRAAVEFCAPSGSLPMLRGGSVALALARATWHYTQALAVAWRVYRAPGSGVWQGLHRVFHFAHEHRLDSRPIDDPIAGRPVEIRTLYLQSLLMAISHPLAFSQVEQDTLWQGTGEFARHCTLLVKAPAVGAPVVPRDADHGPGPEVVGDAPEQWLDMDAFSHEVDAALTRERDGFSSLLPARGNGIRVPVEMLQRLKRAFGLAAARSHKRLPATHTITTVFGLSSVHYFLAGRRDFDLFMRQASQHISHVADRASWAGAGSQSSKVPVHEAQVLDQSLGGYRMSWEHASQIRARVGELVGLTFSGIDEEPEWMLGVVRWLRYGDDGGLAAGVELLSRRTVAVGLRVRGKDGFVREPLRAVEMQAVGGEGRQFLAPNSLDTGATRIEVVRDQIDPDSDGAPGPEEILAGVDVLLNAGDYALLRPLRNDLVVESSQAELAQ